MKEDLTAYIAGPMRGYPDFNFPAFFEAEGVMRDRGFHTFNPAQKDQDVGFDPKGMDGSLEDLVTADFDLNEALSWDTQRIIHDCDTLVLLDGWEQSSGAKAEYALARALSLTVLEYHARTGRVSVLHDKVTLDV